MYRVEEQLDISDELAVDESEEWLPSPYEINSYGADFTVEVLVQKLDKKTLYVPGFQRKYVWNIKEASRYIESLLLGLPVPEIFLTKDKDKRLMVVDGNQRLTTIQSFIHNRFQSKNTFKLTGIKSKYNGMIYNDLDEKIRNDFDNAVMHGVIFEQTKPEEDNNSIYEVFERLNTGGRKLHPHEIRYAVYHNSDMIVLVNDLNKNEYWRQIFGSVDKRMRDQELILRFFALYDMHSTYRSPMKKFLNDYANIHSALNEKKKNYYKNLFQNTISLVSNSIGNNAFKPKGITNAAYYDSVMVGIAYNYDILYNNQKLVEKRYSKLISLDEYASSCTKSTADKKNVNTRIGLSIEMFG